MYVYAHVCVRGRCLASRARRGANAPRGHSITQLGRGVGRRGSPTHSCTYITGEHTHRGRERRIRRDAMQAAPDSVQGVPGPPGTNSPCSLYAFSHGFPTRFSPMTTTTAGGGGGADRPRFMNNQGDSKASFEGATERFTLEPPWRW